LAIALASHNFLSHDRPMNSHGTPDSDERSYTLAEVARLMMEGGRSCTIGALREACKQGTLKSFKKRGIQLVSHSDFVSFINGPGLFHPEDSFEAVEDKAEPLDHPVVSQSVRLAEEAEVTEGAVNPVTIVPVSGIHKDDHCSDPEMVTAEASESQPVDEEIFLEEGFLRAGLRLRCEEEALADGTRQRHGLFQCWFENDQLAAEGCYQHGAPDGLWQQWHANGEKQNEGHFENGLQVGLWTTWDEAGCKLQEGPYLAGQAHGSWAEYHGNGTVWRECSFEHGQIKGSQKYYNSQGQPLGDEYGIQDGI
jgi:hypothetical protein